MNVLITGASSGIGAALAVEFASRGANVGLIARRAEKLAALLNTLPTRQGSSTQPAQQHRAYCADVNDKDALIAVCKQFEAESGGADIVIANAGISIGVDLADYNDLDVVANVFTTNVVALATTFHPFIEPMRARGRGKLVGIASVAGIRGLPGSGAYCGSKAAVISFCESARVENKKYGVEVITISPGFVNTELVAKNAYAMPFLMQAPDFARSACDAILAGASYRVIPWQMGIVAKLLRLLPNWLFDKATANRKRKPRKAEITQ
jgi:short-subunit dehydrogenase